MRTYIWVVSSSFGKNAKKSLKIQKGQSEDENRRRTDNIMAKR